MTPKRRSHSAEVVDLTGHDADGLLTQDGSAAPTQRNKRQRKPKAESVNAVNPTSAHQVSAPQEGTSASALATPRRRRSSQGQQPQERRTDEYGAEVRFRATPTKDITDRIARAMPGSGHRMFLISTTQVRPAGDPQGAEQAYAVLGATGNVYDVVISRHCRCNCPDFPRSHLCKHILFVLLRVLAQRPDCPLLWQRALTESEVDQLLQGATSRMRGPAVEQSVLASQRVRDTWAQYNPTAVPGTSMQVQPPSSSAAAAGTSKAAAAAAASGNGSGSGGGSGSSRPQRPVQGDCPICFDDMDPDTRKDPVTSCSTCGNHMHASCFAKWAESKRKARTSVTCVYCRAPWLTSTSTAAAVTVPPNARPPAAGGARTAAGAVHPPHTSLEGGYLNLARYSEAHAGVGGSSLRPYTNPYSSFSPSRARRGGGGGGRGSRGRGGFLFDEDFADDENGE